MIINSQKPMDILINYMANSNYNPFANGLQSNRSNSNHPWLDLLCLGVDLCGAYKKTLLFSEPLDS